MKNNVAILTNFQDQNPGYSLSGIVMDQCRMLLRHGHKVFLFVNERFNNAYDKDSGLDRLLLDPNFTIEKKTKFLHLTDYSTSAALSSDHREGQEQAAQVYSEYFKKNNIKVVFTHDFVFTGWNLPYAAAVNTTGKKLRTVGITDTRWFHWIHSVPSGTRDWWNLAQYGTGHKLVFPNSVEKIRVAESFRCSASDVIIIPHIKDIRTWYDFGSDSLEIIDACPNLMAAEVVQVYPCSTDRLEAKQVDTVLSIFSAFKEAKMHSFVLFANQWATGKQQKEDIGRYVRLGQEAGLRLGEDFAFTSELNKKYAAGISRKCLRELQLLSNLFIFPTKEESFGLVGPEASFSGAMVVINRSLTMMFEVMGPHCPNFDFGSFHQNTPNAKNPEYLTAVAMSILDHMASDQSLMTKTRARRKYNMDNLYYSKYSYLIESLPHPSADQNHGMNVLEIGQKAADLKTVE